METELRKWRVDMKLKQGDAAAKCNVPIVSFQRYEAGWQKPSIETAKRISKALDTSVERLWPGKQLRSLTSVSSVWTVDNFLDVKIVSEKFFRSNSRGVNRTDDMVRVVMDMPIRTLREMKNRIV